MKNILSHKWGLALRVLPWTGGVIVLKLVLDQSGIEPLSLSPLFNSLIAANVFLLGFLLTGTLSDYKESEKLPGELASSIETINDEFLITHKNKNNKVTKEALMHLRSFTSTLIDWFQKKERTNNIMDQLNKFNDFFLEFEKLTQPNFIVRLKQEQHFLRRTIHRIHHIREVNFVSVGYAVAEITTALLIIGFLFAKIEPFYESLFFVGIATFLLLYLIVLIKELDNPFEHYSDEYDSVTVSLKPLLDLEQKLKDDSKRI